MNICSIEGCARLSRRKLLCDMHYIRLWRGQDIGPSTAKRAPKGAGKITSEGYHAIAGKLEHILVAEKALGHALPPGAVVHHVNGNRSDNRPENLVVCPDQAYHFLLHQRQRALDACGHADWLKCTYCKQYDAVENLYLRPDRNEGFHRECRALYAKAYYVKARHTK